MMDPASIILKDRDAEQFPVPHVSTMLSMTPLFLSTVATPVTKFKNQNIPKKIVYLPVYISHSAASFH